MTLHHGSLPLTPRRHRCNIGGTLMLHKMAEGRAFHFKYEQSCSDYIKFTIVVKSYPVCLGSLQDYCQSFKITLLLDKASFLFFIIPS